LFFSSRRRHTRSKRDWSSDVCSSDLYEPILKFKLIIGRLFTFKRPFPLKMPLLGRYYLLSDQTFIGDNHLGVYQAYITFYNDEHKKERECPLSKKRFLLSCLFLR